MSLLGRLVELKEQTHKVQILAVMEDSTTAQILHQVELSLTTTIARIAKSEVDHEIRKLDKQKSALPG